jgi:hypothetical protein
VAVPAAHASQAAPGIAGHTGGHPPKADPSRPPTRTARTPPTSPSMPAATYGSLGVGEGEWWFAELQAEVRARPARVAATR